MTRAVLQISDVWRWADPADPPDVAKLPPIAAGRIGIGGEAAKVRETSFELEESP